jgi:hypothetical protein
MRQCAISYRRSWLFLKHTYWVTLGRVLKEEFLMRLSVRVPIVVAPSRFTRRICLTEEQQVTTAIIHAEVQTNGAEPEPTCPERPN